MQANSNWYPSNAPRLWPLRIPSISERATRHAIGRQIDGELSGVVSVSLRCNEPSAKDGSCVSVRNGWRVDVAAVLRVGHQGRGAGELRHEVRWQLRGCSRSVDGRRSSTQAYAPRYRPARGCFSSRLRAAAAMCWLTIPSSHAS